MANNKPINRRPWRKKPWAKKRPTRWNAVTNGIDSGIEGTDALLNEQVPIELENGVAPFTVLVSGQVDVEPWADEQEVTLDRIVGTLSFHGYSTNTVGGAGTWPVDIMLKCGIVLNEEVTSENPAPVVMRRLFDQEDLEDTEWMWLWSGKLVPVVVLDENGIWTYRYVLNIPLDIKNRRKIGQQDELTLYCAANPATSGYDFNVQGYTDLRCILMSR